MSEENKKLQGNISRLEVYHTDAYSVAVANGYEGTIEEWLESLKGVKGDRGEKGEKGDPGAVSYETLTPAQKKELTAEGTALCAAVAAGVVTIEQNNNAPLKFWVGTQEEYDNLLTKEDNCFYIIQDDSEYDAIIEKIETETCEKLPKSHINDYGSAATAEEAKEKYMVWFNALGNNEAGRYVMSVNGSVKFVDIYRTNANYGVIMTTQYSSGGANISYASVMNGVLGDLVRSEPQMELGVEYCTLERFLGGVVYAKIISVNTNKEVYSEGSNTYSLSVNHGIENLSSVKSVSAICKNYDGSSFVDMASYGGYGLSVNAENVQMAYDAPLGTTNSTVFIELKYTKKSS